MKFLITGGAGFIGGNLTRIILGQGHFVRILDNFSSGRWENISGFDNEIEVIKGDICDYDTAIKCCKDIDYVVHLAAIASAPASVENPIGSSQVNIMGTLNMLEASRHNHVKRFIFSSSAAVYGEVRKMPISEDYPLIPLSPYAASKIAGEYLCYNYHKLYKLNCICFRYFNVFGPNQNPDSDYAAVIPKFITALLSDKAPTIFGDGEQTRDFIFVDDLSKIILLACSIDNADYAIYNIGSGECITINELLNNLNQILGKTYKASYAECRPGDIRHSVADINKLKKDFAFTPDYDLADGLKKTIENYSRNTS
ncbi:MAG: NAD-dependent epimerase/dehydratase family protein [candidate division Zixibacteria bacterium]|nr:NAD-dependent epimerase/dehydratase family protein [candidate division Zixibacteria bacterium]